MAKLVLYVA